MRAALSDPTQLDRSLRNGLMLFLVADPSNCFTDNNLTANCVTNGSAVGTWLDLSGNRAHAKQATAGNRPTFQTNVKSGRPVVRFDGVDDYLQLDTLGNSMGTAKAGVTIIAVAAPASNPTTTETIINIKNNAGSARAQLAFLTTNRITFSARRLDADGATSLTSGNNAAPNSVFKVISFILDWEGSDGYLRINGVESIKSSAMTSAGRSDTTASQTITIGANSGASSQSDCDIAAIMVWDRPLYGTECYRAEQLLARAYGISWGVA